MPMELQVITLEVVGLNPTGSTVSNALFELNRGRSSIRESALFHQLLSKAVFRLDNETEPEALAESCDGIG